MWVSRAAWSTLMERVEKLETAAKYDTSKEFVVYDPEQVKAAMHYSMGIYGGMNLDHQKISVKDVVQRILTHLGMELQYVKGQPARIDVALPPSAASSGKEK